MNPSQPLAIYYRSEAYQETLKVRSGTEAIARPRGLMGREVASHLFLHQLLKHGCWSSLEVLLESEQDRASIIESCQHALNESSQRRHVHLTPLSELTKWIEKPTAQVLHFPYPPDDRFAWARQSASSPKFAMSGVTHTLCSQAGLESLWRIVTGPWQPYDRLVCTSQAVIQMVRSVTEVMCEFLQSQHGGAPKLPLSLECIPLGTDTNDRRPATPAERQEVRGRLGIKDDQFAMLFVGRLSHHAKAQPYPMFLAAEQAAKKLGQEVCLILCGWFSNSQVRNCFENTAKSIAPNVRLVVVDGLDAWWRSRVWDAADLFLSLADSIQETFGLTIIEAMAHGLPVVASDWNGYRDTVVNGETGYLIPTYMLCDTTSSATSRLITRQISYDQFLAEVGQTVAVCVPSTLRAVEKLATEPDLRRQFGIAGRLRAERLFSWQHVVTSIESMWQNQREQLAASLHKSRVVAIASAKLNQEPSFHVEQPFTSWDSKRAPAIYPPIQVAFANYPTAWLDSQTEFERISAASQRIIELVNNPLVNHSVLWHGRSALVNELARALNALPTRFSMADFQASLKHVDSAQTDSAQPVARSALAWFLKYGVVRVVESPLAAAHEAAPLVTLVTTCMGRLADLQQTLPIMVAQENAAVIVVDYSCPQRAGDWVRANYPSVKVVEVAGRTNFDRSDAKNQGVEAARTPWVCLVDADMILDAQFIRRTRALLSPGRIVRSDAVKEGTGGTFFFEKHRFDQVGGHDSVFFGWGEQDEDLVNAIQFTGAQLVHFPASLIRHLEHDNHARTQFHQDADRKRTHMINRLYRAAKWDWVRLTGRIPKLEDRQKLHRIIRDRIDELQNGVSEIVIEIETGELLQNPLEIQCVRTLKFTLRS